MAEAVQGGSEAPVLAGREMAGELMEPYDVVVIGGGPGGYVAAIRARSFRFASGTWWSARSWAASA